MATAFRATSRGYRAHLDAHERRLLSALCGDVVELLQARTAEVADDADEPAGQQGSVASGSPEADVGGDAPATMENSVFAHFRAELAGLDGSQTLDAPADAVLARLLPESSQDQQQAGQLRRLAEGSLRASKISDLRAARMLLESSPVWVSESQAPVLGRALNDVRLTLATRLEVETEADAERVHVQAVSNRVKDTETFMAEIYTFITWLQETLFTAMIEFLPDDQTGDQPDDEPDDEAAR